MEQYALTLDDACEFLGISRPTATAWIKSGRLVTTRKNPEKHKSPYLTTRQACIAAINLPMHTVTVSVADDMKEEKKCLSAAEVKFGTPLTQSRVAKELRSLLGQRTNDRLKSCMTGERQNSGE